MLSETFVAVIVLGSVVHVFPSTLYSIFKPGIGLAVLPLTVAVPAVYVFPSYGFITSVGVSVIKSAIFCSCQFAVNVTFPFGIVKVSPLLIVVVPSSPSTVQPVNL